MKLVPRIYIWLICISLFSPIFSQQKTDRDIGLSAHSNINDSIHYLLKRANSLTSESPTQAYELAEKAVALKGEVMIDYDIALANKIKGDSKFSLEEYYEAKKFYHDAINFYVNTDEDELKAEVLYSLGRTYYYLAEYSDALDSYYKASNLFILLGEKLYEARTYQNIGLIYHNMNAFDKAEDYYNKALEINKKLNHKTNIAGLYQNLGIIKFRQKDVKAAKSYYDKSLEIYEELKDYEGIGSSYSNLGLIHSENKNYKEALKYYQKAYDIFKKINFEMGMLYALYNIGETYLYLNNYTRAQHFFMESIKISENINYPEGILMNYDMLSKLYNKIGNYKEALKYHKNYTTLKDSIHSEKTMQKIAELESIHNLQIKEREVAELMLENQKQKSHKTTLIFIIALACLILVIIIIAYTQIRISKKELEHHKNNLEKLVEKRTSKLKLEMSERRIAEESDKLKSAFLANMSHELRTPMNAIIAFTNFLRDDRLPKRKKNEYINHIHSAGESLLRLIDDIIDSAKIEAKQLTISKRPTNITRLLSNIYKVHREIKHKGKSVKLVLNCDQEHFVIINTDEMRLKQVINNLLENAFKYTLEGQIEFGFMIKTGGLEFFISDTGIGIPKDKLKTIFERFSRVEYSLDKTFGGTGLGLAISKDLVHLLGGKIGVESEEGTGSIFSFFIPADPIEKIPAIQENSVGKVTKSTEYNWSDKTILIAEDEELNFKVLDSLLSKTKVSILRASDGEEAIEQCRGNKIDLVLMDIQMPKKDGYEATFEIKKMYPYIPVIAQTSFAMGGEKEKCLEAGCDDYLSKPLDINELKLKIAKYFSNQ